MACYGCGKFKMQLNEPRPKKFCKLPPNLPVPLIRKKDGAVYKFKGYFNGFSVEIEQEEDMKNIVSMGYFGKATFSRSYPQFSQSKAEIIRERQYNRRKEWSEKLTGNKTTKKVIVVPDSDEENEDYFTNLQPEYKIDGSGIKEKVWLSLEEAFFLHNAVNCLDVYSENNTVTTEDLWRLFSETDSHFVGNYVVYYYFRAKNWVVKPGIKFGGDYLLYKQGPPFYHASYVVIIDFIKENFERIEFMSRRSMSDVSLMSLNRLCETAGKELLICQVILPENLLAHYSNISDVKIKETLMRRWIPSQERNTDDT